MKKMTKKYETFYTQNGYNNHGSLQIKHQQYYNVILKVTYVPGSYTSTQFSGNGYFSSILCFLST
jgi:hypothetical protein